MAEKNQQVAVIPYMHGLSHNLKRIGGKAGVKVVMSAPDKLSSLCSRTCPVRKGKTKCSVNHKNQYVHCAEGVVYKLPLSCKRAYIGQTGRCLNTRLREHHNKVQKGKEGNLAIHCHECGECEPLFDACTVLFRDSDQRTREIIEAAEMQKIGDCVSTTSISLTSKELAFLDGRC